MSKLNLTVLRVRDLLDYNPETGHFTWLKKPHKKATAIKVGDRAGTTDTDAIVNIFIDGNGYKAHRLVWFWMYGEWPASIIDHINGIRSDNRLDNLRQGTRSLNNQNKLRSRGKKKELLGVFISRLGKYTARIQVNLAGRGIQLHLGTYETQEEAFEVYCSAKKLLHPDAWNESSQALVRTYLASSQAASAT